MSCINTDTQQAWQHIANEASAQRPSPGKYVTVTGGRKYKGRAGIVERHQISKFGSAYQYGSDASHHMRDMVGRYGWVCFVRDGRETFWVNAEHVTVTETLSEGC